MTDKSSSTDVSGASIGQVVEVRRAPGADDGPDASPGPSGGNIRTPQPQVWITLPSGLLSAIQKIFKELLPQAAPTTKNINSILQRRSLRASLDRFKRSFYIYKEYLSPAQFINVEDVKPSICHLPVEQFEAIITLAQLANLTQLALTVIPTLNNGSLVSEDTLLDLDAAFVSSFFTSADLYQQQDDDRSHIVDSFASYIKEVRTYSFIKSLEIVHSEQGSNEKEIVDPDDNLYGTFYLGDADDTEGWSPSNLKGWDFDEVRSDGSTRYETLPIEYRSDFETRIAELRALYTKETVHWDDLRQKFPWERFVVRTAEWIKLIYKYLKNVEIPREESIAPPDDVAKAMITSSANNVQSQGTPTKTDAPETTAAPQTPTAKEATGASDTSNDFLAAIAKSAPAKTNREDAVNSRALPASSPIRPPAGRPQPSLPPSEPSSESSSVSDGGDIPPFQETSTEPSQLHPKVVRAPKPTQRAPASLEPPAAQVAQQEESAASSAEKEAGAKVDSTWSKLLYFLKPTGKNEQGSRAQDEMPAFAEIGRKIRAATTEGAVTATQQDERSPRKRRSFNDPQADARRVSPIDSQRLISSSATREKKLKRTRDEVSDDESDDGFSTLQSQKRPRLSAATQSTSADAEDEDTSQLSQSSRRGRPRKRTDKPAPSRSLKSSVRKAWTNEECDALIEGVAMFGSSWSKIKTRDNNLSQPKLGDRSQMNLKDKARQIAADYYR